MTMLRTYVLVLCPEEGYSELHEGDVQDAVQEIRRRSFANGGFVTFEELNQTLPQEMIDVVVTDAYDGDRDSYVGQISEFRSKLRKARSGIAVAHCLDDLCIGQKAVENLCA